MNHAFKRLAFGLLKLLSRLPLTALYGVSNLLVLLMQRWPGYRKAVVRRNLAAAFPEKSEAERRRIERDFYRHLADVFVETLRLSGMPRRELQQRVETTGVVHLMKQPPWHGRDLICLLGHCGNWEWLSPGLTTEAAIAHNLCVVYHPLSDPLADDFVLNMRQRFGAQLMPMKAVAPAVLGGRLPSPCILALLADQTPAPEKAYWTSFLNQPTPFFRGGAVLARRRNLPITFASSRRLGRGHYETRIEPLVEAPADWTEDAILEAYVRRLEAEIRRQPHAWLWSHRRWKHTPPPAVAERLASAEGKS